MDRHKQLAGTVTTYVPDFSGWAHPRPVFTIWMLLVYIFWMGVTAMCIRFCIQLLSLWKMHRALQRVKINQIKVRLL
ncbi:hypothetical protein ACDQ55_07890 [Chitinophaga sp. 30R24]|uniref:hypothetical protein n=1 Tax=Chitinophaga sp. 30R24 TaxID=3248838 RepID=UPI003B916707